MTGPSLISHYFDVNNYLHMIFIFPQGFAYSLIHLFQKGRQGFYITFNFELTFLIIGLQCTFFKKKVLLLEIKINGPCLRTRLEYQM